MVAYERRGDIGIWMIEDMDTALEQGELEAAEEHFIEVASAPEMRAVVVEVGNSEDLSREVMSHIGDKWTQLGEETDLDGTAYVADGLSRLAISGKNEAEGMKAKGFNEMEPAIEWAREF